MLYPTRQILTYGLIAIALLSTLYTGNVSALSSPYYVMFSLVFGAWEELRRLLGEHSYEQFIYFAELCYMTWFCHTFGGLLYLLFGAVFAVLPMHWCRLERIAVLVLSLIGINIALYETSWSWILSANMYMIAFGTLIIYIYAIYEDQQQLEQMNNRMHKQVRELNDARIKMLRYVDKVESTAQVEERNRIACELHDDLGHKLIRLKLMMDAAEQIKESDPKQTEELYHSVRKQLAGSMDMLRQTVRQMKPSRIDIRTYSLERLVQEMKQAYYLHLTYEVSGTPTVLYPSIEVVLFHNAKEAITNAIHHGGATEIDLELHYGRSRVKLRISNNGQKPTLPLKKGIGLHGMQERTHSLGGTVEWQSGPRFSIHTTIPLTRGGNKI